MSTYVTQLLLEILPAAERRQADGYCPAVPAGRQAGAVQPLRGKGCSDNEREMRIFLPHPALPCLRKDAGVCIQLYLKVELDPVRSGAAEGTSAELSGLVRCRLGPDSGVAPRAPGTPRATQPDGLTRALPAVHGTAGWLPQVERLLSFLPDSLHPSAPFPPLHVAGYCLSAVISARPRSTSGYPSWPKVCHWAAIAVPLIAAHPKGSSSNCVLGAT